MEEREVKFSIPGMPTDKVNEMSVGEATHWIKNRADELVIKWNKGEFFATADKGLQRKSQCIALDYADLEWDYKGAIERAEFVAIRFSQILDLLPNLKELDVLIAGLEAADENNKELFFLQPKETRLKTIKHLRRVVKGFQE